MTSRNVTVHIRAGTAQYKRSLQSATKATVGLSGSLASIGRVAAVGAAGAAVAVAAIGAAAIKVGIESAQAFAKFERSLSQIEGLVGVSREAIDEMTVGLKALSVETARGPQELAEALFFITSAGLEGADAMEALEVSAKAATAGLGDTATIADVVTSAVNAYGDAMGGASTATDVLVATVREGKAEAPALASSLGRVIPIASQMGISFDQVGAAVAAMTRVGLDANESTTALRNVMTSLLNPTTGAAAAMQDLGLSAQGLRSQIREEGLFATLQTLTTAFDGNAEATSAVFGNVRALTGVLSLMGSNAAATEEIFDSLADSTGALDTAFGVTAETGAFAFEQAKTRIEVALLDVGEQILPKLADAMDRVAPLLPDLVAGFGDLAIAMVDLGSQIIPSIASGLSDLPQKIRGVKVVMLDLKSGIEGFVTTADQFLGPWINFTSAFTATEERARSFLQTQIKVHNALADGSQPIDVAVRAMQELTATQNAAPDQLDAIRKQLGLTNEEWGRAATLLLRNKDLLGLTAGEVGHMSAVTEESRSAYREQAAATAESSNQLHEFERSLGRVQRPAGDAGEAVAGMILPLHEVRNALLAAEEAGTSLANTMLALSSPTFKAVKAVESLKKAQANALEVAANSKSSAEDIAAAQLAVVEETLKAQGALDELGFDPANLEGSIQAIQSTLSIGRDEALDLLETLGILDGKQITTLLEIQTSVTGPLAGAVGAGGELHISGARAGGGPVTAGRSYLVGEEGEEVFTPTQNGMIIPNGSLTTNSSSRSVSVDLSGSTFASEIDVQGAVQSGLIAGGVTESVEWAGSTTIR